jgi:uncharacterized protein YqjF (DUF2071 family)
MRETRASWPRERLRAGAAAKERDVATRLIDAAAQAQSLEDVAHRPWPLPARPWTMGQTWRHLLFLHWPVPAERLRPLVPAALGLEEWGGSAWLGITPFRVEGLRARGLLPLPLLSSFDEVNCRTYVRRGDRPGIWFFSLDASSRLAVEAARRTYRLPYRHARIVSSPGRVRAVRADGGGSLSVHYEASGPVAPAEPETLEHFLVERYCLYSGDGDVRADIHHPPWPLQPAQATIAQSGFAPIEPDGEPLCHFAERQDVLIWSPETDRRS